MVDPPVCSSVLTNLIIPNKNSNMVVTFLYFFTEKTTIPSKGEENVTDNSSEISSKKEIKLLDDTPNIF